MPVHTSREQAKNRTARKRLKKSRKFSRSTNQGKRKQ